MVLNDLLQDHFGGLVIGGQQFLKLWLYVATVGTFKVLRWVLGLIPEKKRKSRKKDDAAKPEQNGKNDQKFNLILKTRLL